jgi:sulfate adenylyltransferase
VISCSLIRPYGEKLVDLCVDAERLESARARAAALPSVQLSDRTACDLEALATGAFTPLDRFMGHADYLRVLEEMRLANGALFPIPVTLTLPRDADVHLDGSIALRDSRNHLLATMDVTEVFEWSWQEEAARVLGTRDGSHPFVAELSNERGPKVSGPLQVFDLPRRYDFQELRLTPAQTRMRLEAMGASNVIAFQSIDPELSVPEKALANAARKLDAAVFLDPTVGTVKPGDIEHFARIRAYKTFLAACRNPSRVLLAIVPLARRSAGLRETLWHAIVRRNFGTNYAIVDREDCSIELIREEIGVTPIPSGEAQVTVMRPARQQQGFCIWFTGLSGAGKSTTADIVTVLLQERGRQVTVLDGDVVRTHLSKGLGFSREDRDANIRRIGFVAAEIVRHGGAVICAAVSPYRAARDEVRSLVGKDRFVEVFVDTPIAECERRDVKGMYARARQGKIQGFTGVDDPYEPPLNPELTLDTIASGPEGNAHRILNHLKGMKWIAES